MVSFAVSSKSGATTQLMASWMLKMLSGFRRMPFSRSTHGSTQSGVSLRSARTTCGSRKRSSASLTTVHMSTSLITTRRYPTLTPRVTTPTRSSTSWMRSLKSAAVSSRVGTSAAQTRPRFSTKSAL